MSKNVKAYHHPLVWILLILIALGLFLYSNRVKLQRKSYHQQNETQEPSSPAQAQEIYVAQPFDLSKKLNWLTDEQIEQHKTLYKGYVSKRNEITEKLRTADLAQKGNKTYSPYRSLKIAETYAVNGSILHELYFQNLGGTHQDIGPKMKQLIIDNFGSIQRFKKDFILAAACAHGWVVTSFGLDDKRLHNYVLESHNQNVPVLIIPLLVIDVYEHAYMIDFGIDRTSYIENFWKTIDWDVVEKRIDLWVTPFLK